MKKQTSLEEKMQKHCFQIYWKINDIEENVMFMAAKLNDQSISEDLERQARDVLGGFVGITTILRSASLDLAERFAIFIMDPGQDRVEIPKYDAGDLVQMISDNLNDQAIKFNEVIDALAKKYENKEIDGGMIFLFCESGGNIMKDKRDIVNSLRFLAHNYKKYLYEINSKNTTSNQPG